MKTAREQAIEMVARFGKRAAVARALDLATGRGQLHPRPKFWASVADLAGRTVGRFDPFTDSKIVYSIR